MGNCASAPMVQINDDNYEDLTPSGSTPCSMRWPPGSSPRPARRSRAATPVEPLGGPTTLKEMVTENHDYRGEW
jgi:NADH-quinone oxidoreductase subunit E